MAPRANWKGFLRLSLFSCPVALYPASYRIKSTIRTRLPQLGKLMRRFKTYKRRKIIFKEEWWIGISFRVSALIARS